MMIDKKLLENKRTMLFVSLILLQIVILAVMVFNSYAVLIWGDEILFQVMPVDPRSLFQGDYVILSYPFNNLDLNKIDCDFDPTAVSYQEKVYLVLEPDGDTWSPVKITKDKSKVQDQTFLEAQVLYTMDQMPDPPLIETADPGKTEPDNPKMTILRLKLSIEQYYVPEGKGKEIEDRINKGNIYAKVAVYKGKARVIELINK